MTADFFQLIGSLFRILKELFSENIGESFLQLKAGGKSAYNNVQLEYMYNIIKHAVNEDK
ncbi:hypothetical protein ACVNPZ_03470 [Staphylococcus aureus]